MTQRRSVCVVTGTRAEYGLLYWLMKELQRDAELELQVVATGMHLSPEFGSTFRMIESDGFPIAARVESLLSSDSATGIGKSIGLGVIGFADTFARLRPDVVVLLGDRFEILSAATAAMVVPIAVAHIGGGDYGEATYDNLIRHAVTKMSHVHFVTHEKAAQRVRQLGEDPTNIFNVGSLAVDSLRATRFLRREELGQDLGVSLPEKMLLVTYHPTTMDIVDTVAEFYELLRALEMLMADGFVPVFTQPNCDNNSSRIRTLLDEFHREHPNTIVFESLGTARYLSMMRLSSLVIGNSSSGIYEAPLMSVPSLDVGNRQRGRERGSSVASASGSADTIYAAARGAMSTPLTLDDYPYAGAESPAAAIARVLKSVPLKGLTYKRFFDMPA